MTITRTHRAAVLVSAVIIASLSLTGCGSIVRALSGGSGEATAQADANTDIFDLKVGDCKMEDVPGAITDTNVVPCSESHDEEVYFEFEFELEEGDFPGEDAISAKSDERCHTEFEPFVGIAYEESVLDFFSFQPTAQGWDDGDRVVQCVIWDPAGPVVGTLAGTNR